MSEKREFIELPEELIEQLRFIGNGCENKGLKTILKNVLQFKSGDTTPFNVDAESAKRHEAPHGALA